MLSAAVDAYAPPTCVTRLPPLGGSALAGFVECRRCVLPFPYTRDLFNGKQYTAAGNAAQRPPKALTSTTA